MPWSRVESAGALGSIQDPNENTVWSTNAT